jgi:hypothetical protein
VKTHFRNPAIPPVTPAQLRAVGQDPTDLWFSPTFRSWVFGGALARANPYRTTGAHLAALHLTPNPDA